jgi:succinate dehydrogenase flavin-adding protein (antitoxin of CptAB toxin-antitoxin module)
MVAKKGEHKKVDFIMNTDWLFQGIIDAEQKQYVLLNYFQKLNKHLENMEVYPMFIELSLHLGNIQTLINQNKILYTQKKFLTNDDELLISDLKIRDIPEMSEKEIIEYHQILKNSQPQLYDYFGIAKSIWTIVYDSVDIILKKNKNNIKSKCGFFYFKSDNNIYIWKYTTKRVYKTKGQTKTSTKLIYYGEQGDLTIQEILSNFSKTYVKDNEDGYPIFEVISKDIYPIEETLLPISKRKIVSFISQQNNYKKTKIKNGGE